VLKLPHIHIIHVGSVTNKGTHALLKSEVLELRRIYENAEISVSTSDVETLKHLETNIEAFPSLVDIPYERSDLEARKYKYDRDTLRYQFHILIYTFLMFLQAFLSILSCVLVKANFKPIYRGEVIKQLKDSDLIVSTSDENFKEGSLYLPFNIYWKLACWSMLFSRMWDILIAKKLFKKPIVVFPNSVGPFRTWLGRLMARTSLNNVDLLLLREPHSYLLLKDLKIKTPTLVTSDIAIMFESHQTRFAEALPRPIVGVSPGLYAASFSSDKQWKFIIAHSEVLDYFIEKYGFNVVFLPHEVSGLKHDDLAFCKVILQNMKHRDKAKIIYAKTLEEFKNYIRQLDLLITSRMHPAVLACSDKVPTVVIFYDHKQTGLFKQLGLSCCTINVNQVSYENLLPKVEFIWNNKEKIKEQMARRVPVLQKDVRTKIKKACLGFIPSRYQ
jgi:colanic acid/amylovoran biosynthesis protein